MCSLQCSWRAAGCCFLDNDLYALSYEHTFPMSCSHFSNLDKLNSCSYTVFQTLLFSSCSLSSFELILITFPILKGRWWLSSGASSTDLGPLTLPQPCMRLALFQATLSVCSSILLLSSSHLSTAPATSSSFTLAFIFLSFALPCAIWFLFQPISPVFQASKLLQAFLLWYSLSLCKFNASLSKPWA